LIESYAAALLWTVAVEVTAAACWPRSARPEDLLWTVASVNLLTHPIAYLFASPLGFWPTEAGVVVSEAFLYRGVAGMGWKASGVLALATNGCTLVLSFLL